MIHLTENPLNRARAIKQFFDQLGIAYGGSHDCRCVVGPEPFYISQQDHETITKQGGHIEKLFGITNQLCTKAYRHPSLDWLATIIEGAVNPSAIALHRRTHQQRKVTIPVLARADMVDLGLIAEIQTPGSGWGYMTAMYNTLDGLSSLIGPVEGMGEAIKALTGSRQTSAAYILYNDPLFWEVEYFCQQCQARGIPLHMYFKQVPHPNEVKFVRRPPLEDFISYHGASELVEAHLRGDLVIEPDLSLLYDQKIAAAFPFDPRLKNEYPDEVRALFPETYLIQDEINPIFDGTAINWRDIINLSRKQRQFIVKFGGASKGMRAGGKAVFNLSDCSSKEAENIINHALDDWRTRRQPWLIQKRVKKKFDVTFLDPESQAIVTRPYYAVFRPMYFFPRDGSAPTIVDHCALFRKEWKVHGSSDAVNLPVEVNDAINRGVA